MMSYHSSVLRSSLGVIFLLLSLSSASSQSGPAVSCAVGASSSSSPCCTVLGGPPITGTNIPSDQRAYTWAMIQTSLASQALAVEMGDPGYALCEDNNAADTVTAANNQAAVNDVGSLFTQYSCWGGQAATSPGNGIQQIPTLPVFISQVQSIHCGALTFPIAGNWTDWSVWSTCETDIQYQSRMCTNPSPMNGGTNCTGPTIQSQSCQPAGSSSSSATTLIIIVCVSVGGAIILAVIVLHFICRRPLQIVHVVSTPGHLQNTSIVHQSGSASHSVELPELKPNTSTAEGFSPVVLDSGQVPIVPVQLVPSDRV